MNQTLQTIFAALILIASPAAFANSIEKSCPPFELPDSNGRITKLADFQDRKGVVLVFLGTECPLVKAYTQRLNQLAREFRERGVAYLGVMANVQDSAEEVQAFVREYAIDFPILMDAEQTLATHLGATRTPEAFLLDARGVVRYQGRIDDQYDVATKRAQLSRRDLAEATMEVLDGKPVSHPLLAATGCHIGRAPVPSKATSGVTYSNQIARLFQRRCVECHRAGEIAPFSLTSYEESIGWADTILEVVNNCRMPPWFADSNHGKFSNDSRLTEQEKKDLAQWVSSGCPQGDPNELPPPKKFLVGWNIPQPDLVLRMAKEAYHVPAEGVIDYKHFVIDPGFAEDKWVVASEARPGNRSVVHHILVFLKAPGENVELLRGSLLAAYAPGMPPRQLPGGMAKRIPAGSKIVLQIHYTTNGRPQEDLSSLGLVFCEPHEVKQRVESGWAVNFLLTIPPGASAHPVYAMYKFPEDRILFNLTPHMHLRGKSFRYEARYPDGKTEVLLNVPQFDFNWQLEYEFAEPKLMPKGTELRCYAAFDNSASNPANPDPRRWVRFGEQTWDEMMIGWFTAATLPSGAANVLDLPRASLNTR